MWRFSVVIFWSAILGPNFHGSHCQSHASLLKDPHGQYGSKELRMPGDNSENKPVIDPDFTKDVVGVLGKEVRLQCHVTNLGNRTISWMRLRDLQLLTVGRYTYTPDRRFSAHHIPLTHYWQLRIRDVRASDTGEYECQVSSTPPIGRSVGLKVAKPSTVIVGGPDMHVDSGSTINLTCVAKFSPAPPPDLMWYHDDEEISYDSPRGGVSVITEKGDYTTSQLLIQRARYTDSGQYRCVPVNTVEAKISLHILQGENPDAWQTSSSTRSLFTVLDNFLGVLMMLLSYVIIRV